MGRVSRIIKAASDGRRADPPNSLEKGLADRDLPRVIAAWSHMPDHVKRTVMTLVELVEAKRNRQSVVEPSPKTGGNSGKSEVG